MECTVFKEDTECEKLKLLDFKPNYRKGKQCLIL